jgi:hypothetical protein
VQQVQLHIRHPDRSEAMWKNLLFLHTPTKPAPRVLGCPMSMTMGHGIHPHCGVPYPAVCQSHLRHADVSDQRERTRRVRRRRARPCGQQKSHICCTIYANSVTEVTRFPQLGNR